ncbi:hypothetical protein FQN55_005827 [Onygenales sp. PD_40]|nr:hypothetical protein FQN55_005827 [Onygenales sp. PD_40]KAK2775734.1 hypothetical protein FQN52_003892 [Onygenales sp. PD_12]KAK2777792.1 hypothetical protein FQN53_002073 [Emmonsiellopsis sp. PD_33]
MLRCLPRVLAPSLGSRSLARPTARYLHQVTGTFINPDAKGCPVSTKVPIVVGDPGEAYVLIETDIGRAFHAASLRHAESTASLSSQALEDTCKVTFFHDSQHFGFGPSTYPQLHIPTNLPRPTDSNASPATLNMGGVMHDITLDGTPDAEFSKSANASYKNLKPILDKLKDM